MNELITKIAAMQKELEMRENASRHLTGIPKIHNASSIEHLCDALCNAHIEMLESA